MTRPLRWALYGVAATLACATPQVGEKPEEAPAAPPATTTTAAEAPAAAPPDNGRTPAPTEPIPFRPFLRPAPLTTVLLPVAQKPIVSFRLVFHSGSVDDPKGKEGLTYLTGAVLESGGTKELTSTQLREALYPMAAELSLATRKEFTVLEGRVHQDNLDRFLKILTDVLVEPRFDPREFERLKTDALNEVKNGLRGESSERLGKVALDALLYPDHPYGHYEGGTVQGLTAITLDDVKAHARNVFTQDRLVVGLAGAVTPELEKRVVARLAALPKTGTPLPTLPPAPGHHGRAIVVQKDGISTAISLGSSYPVRRGDPDFFALAFAFSALGEHRQFTGALMNELREKRGLNYGDFAYAEAFQQEGGSTYTHTNIGRSEQAFSLWLRPVEPANGMFATRGAVYFLQRQVNEGIPPDRFEITRGFLQGYTRLWEQTDPQRLGYAIDDLFYGTKDLLGSYRQAMARFTPESVREVVRRYVSPSRLNYAFVAKDAKALAELLASQPPSPIQYPTPKEPAVLEEDKKIAVQPLAIDPAAIQVVEAATFMER